MTRYEAGDVTVTAHESPVTTPDVALEDGADGADGLVAHRPDETAEL